MIFVLEICQGSRYISVVFSDGLSDFVFRIVDTLNPLLFSEFNRPYSLMLSIYLLPCVIVVMCKDVTVQRLLRTNDAQRQVVSGYAFSVASIRQYFLVTNNTTSVLKLKQMIQWLNFRLSHWDLSDFKQSTFDYPVIQFSSHIKRLNNRIQSAI